MSTSVNVTEELKKHNNSEKITSIEQRFVEELKAKSEDFLMKFPLYIAEVSEMHDGLNRRMSELFQSWEKCKLLLEKQLSYINAGNATDKTMLRNAIEALSKLIEKVQVIGCRQEANVKMYNECLDVRKAILSKLNELA